MLPRGFAEKDPEKLSKFLNFIASKAQFQLSVKEVIEFYGLLSWAQKELLPQIEGHVFELKKKIERAPE